MRKVYVGQTAKGERVYLDLELTSRPTSPPHQNTEHAKTDSVLELAMSVAVYDHDSRETDGGQARDSLRAVAAADGLADGPYSKTQIERLGTLWERHHLNGLTPGCVHQGETWRCSGAPDGIHADTPIENGWPAVYALFGPHPYPHRGDICYSCGRARWDEPSDFCPVSGYHWGSAWLSYAIPVADLAELRALEALGLSAKR